MSKNLKAILLYTLLTVIFTWPLLPHITTHYPSTMVGEGGDPNMYIWFMNSVAKKVADPNFHPSQIIFYPGGMNFLAGYEAPIILAVSTPVILLTHNPILAYNILLLLAFISASYACYLLILYLTDSYFSALITGFSFGFSEYMVVRGTQHLDLLFLFAPVLVVLYGFKFLENPNKKNILLLGLYVFLTALCAWYYLVGSLIFLGLLFLFNLSKFWPAKKQYFILAAVIAGAVLIPAAPMFLNRSNASFKYVDRLVETRGADPVNFFLPHPYILDATTSFYKYMISPYESTSYFGLVGLIALLTLAFSVKKIKIPNRGLWIATMVIFIFIAFGNHLLLLGHNLRMPFYFLKNFLPFNRLRAPNRFFIFSYLGATVIFGYCLAFFNQRIQKKYWRGIFAFFVVFFLTLERLIFPYPILSVPVPEFYHTIGSNPETFAVADIPLINPGLSIYDYYQIYHKKPIVDGEYFWTAYNDHTFDFIKSNPLLLNSVPCDQHPPQIDIKSSLSQLSAANVRYVIVHNLILRDQDCPDLIEFVHKTFKGQKAVFSDGEITVYSTQP